MSTCASEHRPCGWRRSRDEVTKESSIPMRHKLNGHMEEATHELDTGWDGDDKEMPVYARGLKTIVIHEWTGLGHAHELVGTHMQQRTHLRAGILTILRPQTTDTHTQTEESPKKCTACHQRSIGSDVLWGSQVRWTPQSGRTAAATQQEAPHLGSCEGHSHPTWGTPTPCLNPNGGGASVCGIWRRLEAPETVYSCCFDGHAQHSGDVWADTTRRPSNIVGCDQQV